MICSYLHNGLYAKEGGLVCFTKENIPQCGARKNLDWG